MKTLEQYLRENWDDGYTIDHAIRSHVHEDGSVSFYIHAQNKNSDTLDFFVTGNQLSPVKETVTR